MEGRSVLLGSEERMESTGHAVNPIVACYCGGVGGGNSNEWHSGYTAGGVYSVCFCGASKQDWIAPCCKEI